MAEPRTGTCSPWASIADLPSPCGSYQTNAGLMADALQLASNVLFRLTGRQWPGVCTATVRPNARYRGGDPAWWRNFYGFLGPFGYQDSWGYCDCNREERTGCSSLSEITLGGYPVISIDEVKVDGVVLDPARYRVDDYEWLVRLPDADGSAASWPCCQRHELPSSEVGTFGVTFKYGLTPEGGAREMTAGYACELAKAWDPNVDPSSCRLPNRVIQISRQGVTMQMLDPSKVIEGGMVGLPEVDTWIRSINPNKLQRRARAWSPDIPKRVRRAGTWVPPS